MHGQSSWELWMDLFELDSDCDGGVQALSSSLSELGIVLLLKTIWHTFIWCHDLIFTQTFLQVL